MSIIKVDSAGRDDSPSLLIELQPAPTQTVNIPDGGLQAWLSVLGGVLVVASTFGYSNSFGVFQDYYVLSGSSSASNISWIGSVQLFFTFAMGLPAGKLFDLGSFHYTSIGGSLLYVFSLFMLSLADPSKYYQLILSQGIGMGIGAGLLLVPAVSVQAHHWKKWRSLAMGTVVTGSGFGGVFYPIMLNRLIHGHVGFAWGVRITGFLTLGLLVAANCIMRTRLPNARQRAPGLKPDVKAIMSDWPYILLLIAGFLGLWGLFYPYFYLQLWVNLHGLSPNLAFYTIAILNASSIPGRIILNLLADRFGPLNVLPLVLLTTGSLIFVMFGATNVAGVIIFSILYGFFSGASTALYPPTAGRFAKGEHEIGLRLGVMYFACSFGILTGTPIVGALYDSDHEWYKPTVFSAVVLIAGGVLVLRTRHLVLNVRR
ncbi:uncharacterized protein FIBRA_02594 [Fibroporia radiculosa]|uniref:Major facilitator superfamily (MFS) profile domain-containing protein n=1 Tax=Fibroporia radiculosa TaxID=599839 RepID=J4GMZ9_9APHY|nr:uncharacterized protein FIBRA_02594 [Fibroporia radiculosa]CCM00560.1 predicted protein [Fibroporia radiculosa]